MSADTTASPSPAAPREPKCVFCGRCLEVCPLFASTGKEELSPRAKFALNTALDDPDHDIAAKAALRLTGKCLSCGKCEKACPNKLCAPRLVTDLRAANPNLRSMLWGLWVGQAKVLWPMMATLSRFAPHFRYGRLESMLSGLKALDAGQTAAPWVKAVSFQACGKGRKAVVFPGCVASHVRPQWNETAGKLLRNLGFDMQPNPGFTCCACTLGHAGLKEPQRQMQLKNLQAWRDAGRPEIVVFCATCRCGLKGYADAELGWELGERERWLHALTPLSTLAGKAVYEVQDNAPAKVHYHAPCHGAGAGLDQKFLRTLLGERLSTRGRKNLCCGFGGSLKLSAPELSDQVAKRCLEFYAPEQGELMLSGCAGCVIQLRAGAPAGVKVGHWLEIIA